LDIAEHNKKNKYVSEKIMKIFSKEIVKITVPKEQIKNHTRAHRCT
jgi:hypothetical protein